MAGENKHSAKRQDNAEDETEDMKKMRGWLNKNMKIVMTDNRTLIGVFLCTDKDRNVILGSCQEFTKSQDGSCDDKPRTLGLAMVPGHHIVSIYIDQ